MRETYQILTDYEGNAHILFLSGGVHAYLSHKQARELANLGNQEVEDRTAKVDEFERIRQLHFQERERLEAKIRELSDSLEALRAIYAAENPPSPEFAPEEVQPGASVNEGL
jgi:hypothetical protein